MTIRRSVTAVLVSLVTVSGGPAGFAGERPSLEFEERSEAWGTTFRHHHGGSGNRLLMETMVGGVVIFDYDGDGDHDLFFVDGGELPGYEGEPARSILLRNDDGTFRDATEGSGIEVTGYGSGGTAGDVDGDGDVDLYVTAYRENQLFLNLGDGGFRDATRELGAEDSSWSMSAAFGDPDLDGDLDLYVANYALVVVDPPKRCTAEGTDIASYCHPDLFDGLPDRYLRNDGAGGFVEATAEVGLAKSPSRGLGVVLADFQGDGWPDIYVANDLHGNFLFRNRGDGTFEDVSLLGGTAYGDRSQPEAGMGVDADDLDGDGDLDLVVTNFEFESNAVYVNAGRGLFTDGRFRSRLAQPSIPVLGFGVDLADLDHDRDLDAVIANGHVLDNASVVREQSRYAQPNHLFVNRGDGVFDLVEGELRIERPSRGLATGDLDLDGDLDLVVVNVDDRSETWENLGAPGRWLQVDLSTSRSAPLGVGTRVVAEVDGERLVREAKSASSYLSQNAASLHFGLGPSAVVDRLVVHWPRSGRRVYREVPASRRIRLVEGGE